LPAVALKNLKCYRECDDTEIHVAEAPPEHEIAEQRCKTGRHQESEQQWNIAVAQIDRRDAITRLVGALLLKQNNEWALQRA